MVERLRDCGKIERITCAHHYDGYYLNFAQTAQYNIEGEGVSLEMWRAMLSQAVSRFATKHGALCCGIVGEEGQNPYFVRLGALDLGELIKYQFTTGLTRYDDVDESLAPVLGELHSRRWEDVSNRPGWEVRILWPESEEKMQRIWVIFLAHHGLMDGISGCVFHRELARELPNYQPGQSPVSHVVIPSEVTMPPPLEALIHIPTSWAFWWSSIWQAWRPLWWTYIWPASQDLAWTGLPITRECVDKYKTNIKILTISPDESQLLVGNCRHRKTTVTGLLHALAVASLVTHVPEAERFLGHTPYSMRPWTKTSSKEAMVNQTSDSIQAYERHWIDALRGARERGDLADVIWDMAAFYRAEFRREMATVPLDNDIATLSGTKDWHQANRDAIGSRRPITFEVSNIGAQKISEDNLGETSGPKVTVNSLIFSQSVMITAGALTLSASSVVGGGINVAVSWQSEALPADVPGAFCQELLQGLKMMILKR